MVARILRTGFLIVFSFGILMTVEAYAQTGALRGTVVDEQKQPVAGVQILISFLGGMTRELKAETNENGNFIRVGLQPGNYKLTFSKEGHQPFEITEIRVRSSWTTPMPSPTSSSPTSTPRGRSGPRRSRCSRKPLLFGPTTPVTSTTSARRR
jgi:hypothetical protein